MAKRWSEDDEIYLEYLLLYGSETSYKEAAKFLGRTENAVKLKASKIMKFNKQIDKRRGHWSEKEDDFLRSCFQNVSYKDMARLLGRTLSAVQCRISELNLRKQFNPIDFKDEIIDMIGNGMNSKEIAKELNMTRDAVYYFCYRNNIKINRVPLEESKRAFIYEQDKSLHHVREARKKYV